MEIYDADKLIGEPRKLRLGGKEFDVSILPARTSILAFVNREAIDRFTTLNFSEDDYNKVLEIVVSALKPQDKTVSMEWLDAHLTSKNFSDVVTYIMKPAMAEVDAGGDDKKKESDSEELNLD